jgi:hypothetical protein
MQCDKRTCQRIVAVGGGGTQRIGDAVDQAGTLAHVCGGLGPHAGKRGMTYLLRLILELSAQPLDFEE